MAKLLVAFYLCVATTMITAQAETYSELDNVKIEEALSNEQKVNDHFKCLMETGPCTDHGEAFKRLLPEAIANECAKCTEKQKAVVEKIIKFLYQNKNDMWKQLEAKYDPQGLIRQRYMQKEN